MTVSNAQIKSTKPRIEKSPKTPTKQIKMIAGVVLLILFGTCMVVVTFLFDFDEFTQNICLCFLCSGWFTLIFSINSDFKFHNFSPKN